MRPVAGPARLEGMSPVEVAGRLRHLEGLVFFDTAGNVPSGIPRPVSVIAAKPVRVLRGNGAVPADLEQLRQSLSAGPKLAGDQGFPIGGLCGWFNYEGGFVFG